MNEWYDLFYVKLWMYRSIELMGFDKLLIRFSVDEKINDKRIIKKTNATS